MNPSNTIYHQSAISSQQSAAPAVERALECPLNRGRFPCVTPDITAALETDRTIDITTIGRTSGEPRRLEIWFHNVDGRIFITGMPGSRDWYANLQANSDFTFHLKESVQADLPAQARALTELSEKRAVLEVLLERLGYADRIDTWLADSPLVEVTFP